MFLLDCEDLFSINLDINISKIVDDISALLEDDLHIKLLTCEHYWNGLDINSKSLIKDAQDVIKQTLEYLSTIQLDFFCERRYLVFKNRLVILRILEKGESELAQVYDELV